MEVQGRLKYIMRASSYSSGFVGWCSSLSLHLSFTVKYTRLAVTPTSRNTSTMTSVPSVPPTASQLNDDGLVVAMEFRKWV